MKTCFVIQGFGSKTDYTDGRVLNLDASYEVIKQAVEDAGLKCIRADEIVHTGTIDIPMYEQLLRADLVIADLSTYNVNAAFELGVRYGLKPRATIVLAEEQFKSPFDVNHIVIRRYKHMGDDLSAREARRLREELMKVIETIKQETRFDSPVYSMLKLRPPQEEELVRMLEAKAEEAVQRQASDPAAAPVPPAPASAAPQTAPPVPSAAPSRAAPSPVPRSVLPDAPGAAAIATAAEPQMSARDWLDRAQEAMKRDDFVAAKTAWLELSKLNPSDPYIAQQLALATYKAKVPSAYEALIEAHGILEKLSPATTNDPETMGLWGAVHKRLWELRHDPADLSKAVAAYERGFLLKQDYYNGINLAFLLNVRAVESARRGERDEAIADEVQAKRVRRNVTLYAEPLAEDEDLADEKRFWPVATLWEAALGLGDAAGVTRWDAAARALKVPGWMQQSRIEQGEKLQGVQQELKKGRSTTGT